MTNLFPSPAGAPPPGTPGMFVPGVYSGTLSFSPSSSSRKNLVSPSSSRNEGRNEGGDVLSPSNVGTH
eukprot:7211137-Pyramimonas_sp.AAC.1